MNLYDEFGNQLLDPSEVRTLLETRLGAPISDDQFDDWRRGGRRHDPARTLQAALVVGRSQLYTRQEVERWCLLYDPIVDLRAELKQE